MNFGPRRSFPARSVLAVLLCAACSSEPSVALTTSGPVTCDGGACGCTRGTCGVACTGGCALDCNANDRCDQQCNGARCDLVCNSNAGCTQRCAGGGCALRCNSVSGEGCALDCPGGGCTLQCNSTTSCRITGCARGCTLRCTSVARCENSCADADAGCVTTR